MSALFESTGEGIAEDSESTTNSSCSGAAVFGPTCSLEDACGANSLWCDESRRSRATELVSTRLSSTEYHEGFKKACRRMYGVRRTL